MREAGIADAGAQFLALAAEVALADRRLQNEILDAGKTCRKLQFAGRLFLDIGFEDDAVGRTALLLFNFQIFLEKAQRFDPVGRTLDLEAVERIAFVQTEFPAHDLVLSQGVAVDIDPLDIDPVAFRNLEQDVHGQRVFVPGKFRTHIGKSIAEQASRFRQALDRIFHLLSVIEIARFHGQLGRQEFRCKIANLAFHRHIAKFVAIAFFHHIGDDEIPLVGRELGHGGDHAKIGIAFGQVELAQLLLVKGQPVRIIGVAGAEEAVEPRLLGDHLAAQLAVGKGFVADDVDLLDLGLGPFVDLEHNIDAVLVELHHFRLDAGGKATLALVELNDAGHVSADLRTREYLARGEPDFRIDLVFLDPLVALQQNPVDHRILDDLDNHRAVIVADADILEQFCFEQILQRLVSRFLGVGLADAQFHVGQNRRRFEALGAFHHDRAYGVSRRSRRWRGLFRVLRLRRRRNRRAAQDRAAHQQGQKSLFMIHRQTRFHTINPKIK